MKKLNNRQLHLIIIGFLIIGSILRLLWAADMEWKYDEKTIFALAQQIADGTVPWPVSGFPSSVIVRIPGMSVWCFAIIAKFVDSPVAMVRWVQWLNVGTLWLFFGFITWQIPKIERLTWLWGLAIASVNPFAILMSRRIWQPDILAPFCLLIFLGHWFRRQFWGSFLWGFVGILSGQVQMGGFFLVMGLFLSTVWFEYKQNTLKQTAWLGWFLGTAIGFIPLIPWLWEVLPQMGGYRRSLVALFVPKFYSQWLTSALGVNLSYTLKEFFWSDFLKEPLIFGSPSYLMIPAHLFLLGIGIYPFYRWFKSRKKPTFPPEDSHLSFYLKAMGLFVGIVFTLSRVNVHPYYITIIFPFTYIWLARLYKNKLKVLIAIALVQLLISCSFLMFVHRTGGMPYCGAGYGFSYRFQVEKGIPCEH
ncbi:MAG: hypothetical protein WA999_09255 [Spirulinaceae cyanobacterium]